MPTNIEAKQRLQAQSMDADEAAKYASALTTTFQIAAQHAKELLAFAENHHAGMRSFAADRASGNDALDQYIARNPDMTLPKFINQNTAKMIEIVEQLNKLANNCKMFEQRAARK